jgi:quercetin dioxygenase-like cupin family protein
MKPTFVCILTAAVLALPICATAQGRTGFKVNVLVTNSVTNAPDRELSIASVEVAPGGTSGLHTHPGEEYGTVVEGSLMVKIGDADFKPLRAGETFSAPMGTPMEVKNISDQPTKFLNVLIIEKGKPRGTPVHAINH